VNYQPHQFEFELDMLFRNRRSLMCWLEKHQWLLCNAASAALKKFSHDTHCLMYTGSDD